MSSSSSVLHQQSVNCFINNYQQLGKKLNNGLAGKRVNFSEKCVKRRSGAVKVKARGGAVMDMVVAEESGGNNSATSAFPFFQNQSQPEDTPASKLELADPEFYKMGFVRSMRAYGVEFREGPNGFGVYASRDIEPSRRAKARRVAGAIPCGVDNGWLCEPTGWNSRKVQMGSESMHQGILNLVAVPSTANAAGTQIGSDLITTTV